MEVRGLKLEVIEKVTIRVSTLQHEGKRWFNQNINDPSLKAEFLQEEEQLVKKGREIDGLSLPQPWEDVALFIITYITCEGRVTIVFNYQFPLLNHLRHELFINLPYFLMENLKHMSIA